MGRMSASSVASVGVDWLDSTKIELTIAYIQKKEKKVGTDEERKEKKKHSPYSEQKEMSRPTSDSETRESGELLTILLRRPTTYLCYGHVPTFVRGTQKNTETGSLHCHVRVPIIFFSSWDGACLTADCDSAVNFHM